VGPCTAPGFPHPPTPPSSPAHYYDTEHNCCTLPICALTGDDGLEHGCTALCFVPAILTCKLFFRTPGRHLPGGRRAFAEDSLPTIEHDAFCNATAPERNRPQVTVLHEHVYERIVYLHCTALPVLLLSCLCSNERAYLSRYESQPSFPSYCGLLYCIATLAF